MKDYTAYCIVKTYYDGEERTEHCFIPADNYADGAKIVDEYFKSELVSVNIELIDTSLVLIPEHLVQEIMTYNFS